MELRHLRYFVAVATELNFSRAAEGLWIAQPALSKQIADLEREIGTPLLHRTKRVVRLTAAGEVFLDHARAILAASEQAKEDALRASRGETGRLSIGFFAAPMMYLLPELIRQFREASPEVAIHMREMTPDQQLVALESGEIDLAFTRPLPEGHPQIETKTLFSEPFFAVVPASHALGSRSRVHLANLSREPFVLLDRPAAPGLYDHVVAACLACDYSPRIVQTADLMATVLTLVAAGQGISIVPDGVRNLRREQVVFLPLSPAIKPIPLVMAWRKSALSPPVTAFKKLVAESLPKLRGR
jgi:DNA-binding transcriptional LysR family regulator